MASPFNLPSTQRKLLYFVLALALFGLNTFVWRGVASPTTPWTITSQADRLELREASISEPELVGSTLRLLLSGSRGLAVTALWNTAIEKQKKNEWNELELIVKSLTKLQPHFLTPWLFQSWNLAYNVAVESDRVRDKYFYISRGIELLAQGERVNKDNPDMRFWEGFYFLNKFGVSDEANTLRSLLQVGCIDPRLRDPAKLRDPTVGPDGKDEFQRFVEANPQLVRRLREQLKYDSRESIIDFVSENRKVPGRFVVLDADKAAGFGAKEGDLLPPDQQFPCLPPRQPVSSRVEEFTQSSNLTDSFDNYQAARSWFSYSIDPLPPAEIMTAMQDRAQRLEGHPGKKLPRSPAEVIFRQYPARAQSYVAERLEKEGFFDETGWVVDAGRRDSKRRLFPIGKDVAVATGVPWAQDAWRLAYEKWREHGVATGMYLEPNALASLREKATEFCTRFNVVPGDPAQSIRLDSLEPKMQVNLLAQRQLTFRDQNLTMTNFSHHFTRSFTEQDKDAIRARKLMFDAQRQYKAAEPTAAIQSYDQAFTLWKGVLDKYPDFRNDDSIQEETYETELKYIDLVREHKGGTIRPALVVADVIGQGLSGGFPDRPAMGLMYEAVRDLKTLPLPVLGPFDGLDSKGKPWISADSVQTVRTRLGLDDNSAAAPPTTPANPAGGATPPPAGAQPAAAPR